MRQRINSSSKEFIHYLIEIRTVVSDCGDTCHQALIIWSLRVLFIDVHGLDQVITALNSVPARSVYVGLLSFSCRLEVLWFIVFSTP